jgi:hypothetical protein
MLSVLFISAPFAFAQSIPSSSSTNTTSTAIEAQAQLEATGSDNIQGGMIAFQGNLNNASGTSVTDGLYNMDFKIYDAPTNGNVKWEESFTGDQRIQVTGGQFSASLGQSVPINLDFDNNIYYLAVTVGGTGDVPSWDSEMTPRKEIITVAELLQQANADGKSVLDEFIEALNSGNNIVVIVDSATMANLLSGLEQQSTNAQNSSATNNGGGGILSQLTEFFVSAFESIQSELAYIGKGVTQILSMLTDISTKVDQIYQAVVVNNGGKVSSIAAIAPSVSSSTSATPTSQQSGSAIVLANQQSININTPAIQSDSNVLITLVDGYNEQNMSQIGWAISNRVSGQYFTITFDQPLASNTVINWWVLNTDSSADVTNSGSASDSTASTTEQDATSASDNNATTTDSSSTLVSPDQGSSTSTDIAPSSSSTTTDSNSASTSTSQVAPTVITTVGSLDSSSQGSITSSPDTTSSDSQSSSSQSTSTSQ